jgi:hypothetical protein
VNGISRFRPFLWVKKLNKSGGMMYVMNITDAMPMMVT